MSADIKRIRRNQLQEVAKLKILHVTNYFCGAHHHIGGAEQACFRTALITIDHVHEGSGGYQEIGSVEK